MDLKDKTETPVTQTEGKTEAPVTQTEEKIEVENNNTEEKTFNQEQVNALLAKERSKMPSKEELKAYNDWKESQKTAEQKQAEAAAKALKIEAENTARGQLLEIMKKGVDFEQAEFIQFKLSKMEGDFDNNLTEYLSAHPTNKTEEKKTTGFSQQGNSNNTNLSNKEYLDKKYGKNPYYQK